MSEAGAVVAFSHRHSGAGIGASLAPLPREPIIRLVCSTNNHNKEKRNG